MTTLTSADVIESIDRLRLATEPVDLFAWEIDFKTNKMLWSPNTGRVLQCDPKVLSNDADLGFFFAVAEDRSNVAREFERMKRGQEDDYALEFFGLDSNHIKICWQMKGKFKRNANGRVAQAFGTTKNITEKRNIQDQLKLVTERLTIAEEAADAIIYDWDITTNKIWRSPGFTRLLGWQADQISQDFEGWSSLRHPEDEERLKLLPSTHGLLPNDRYVLEYRVRHREGHYIKVLDSGHVYRNFSGDIVRFIGVTTDISERKRSESYNARLAAVTLSSHDALFGLTLDGTIETWNPAAERLFGYSAVEAIGQNVSILAHADQREQQKLLIAKALASQVVVPYEARRLRKDGSTIDIAVALAPVRASDGTNISISVAIHDISERKEWEKRQLMLVRELAHRNKNSFAILQGILRSTLRNARNPVDFAEAFSSRLHSLAASQDVLSANEWRSTELGALIRLQLATHLFADEKRIEYTGPVINLAPEYASSLGLIFNELTTNALKYGALSLPNGTVKITWKIELVDEKSDRLSIIWQERGGPKITSKITAGFGMTIIEKSLAEAIVKNEFAEEGLTCSIDLILNHLQPVYP